MITRLFLCSRWYVSVKISTHTEANRILKKVPCSHFNLALFAPEPSPIRPLWSFDEAILRLGGIFSVGCVCVSVESSILREVSENVEIVPETSSNLAPYDLEPGPIHSFWACNEAIL